MLLAAAPDEGTRPNPKRRDTYEHMYEYNSAQIYNGRDALNDDAFFVIRANN